MIRRLWLVRLVEWWIDRNSQHSETPTRRYGFPTP